MHLCHRAQGGDGLPPCLGWVFAEQPPAQGRPACALLFRRYPASVFAAGRDGKTHGGQGAQNGYLLGAHLGGCSCPAHGARR